MYVSCCMPLPWLVCHACVSLPGRVYHVGCVSLLVHMSRCMCECVTARACVFVTLYVCQSLPGLVSHAVCVSVSLPGIVYVSRCMCECVTARDCVCVTLYVWMSLPGPVYVSRCRPDMTFAVDWALSNKYLSMCHAVCVYVTARACVCVTLYV